MNPYKNEQWQFGCSEDGEDGEDGDDGDECCEDGGNGQNDNGGFDFII